MSLAVPSFGAEKVMDYRMVLSPKNKDAALPLLTKFKDAEIMSRVNKTLRRMLDEMSCDAPGGSWTTTASVEYAERDIFSIQIRSSYYCGGAYPTNDFNQSVTFDMRTGRTVSFDGLFKSYAEKRPEILKALYAGHIAQDVPPEGAEKRDDCPDKYDLNDLESYETIYYVSSQGLVLQPGFPHVMEACSFPVIVPFSKTARLIAPGSILSRLQ